MQSGDLTWLLAVARSGSLSAAAKLRGVTVSTASRRLDALEATLGLRLVDRRMNGSRLTPDGERIAQLAEPVVEGHDRLVRAAVAMRTGGRQDAVRISATEFVVSDVLAPAFPKLQARHPQISVMLQVQSDVVSLAARNADLAVRMSRPEGNSLVAKKLPALRLGLFASEEYLSGRLPARLDLSRERLLVYDDSYGRLPELDWIVAMGLESNVALRSGSTRGLLTAAVAGGGIALLPCVFAARAGLVSIALPVELPDRTPWVVVHTDLRRDPVIRAVHAWIGETFKNLAKI